MNIVENSDKIFIRHIPFGKWILGGLLVFFYGGVFVWFILTVIKPQSSFESGTQSRFDLLPILLLAAVILFLLEIKFLPLLFAPWTDIIVSQKTRSVNILSRRIYGAKTERYFFHQIQKFKSYKGKTRLSPAYFLSLVLVNQKVIKLKIPIGDKNSTVKLVKKLNKFINQPKP